MRFPKLRRHPPSNLAFVESKKLFNPPRKYLGEWDSPEAKTAYAQVCARLAGLQAERKPVGPIHPQDTTIIDIVVPCLERYQRLAMSKRNPKRSEFENMRAATRILREEFRYFRVVDFTPVHFTQIRTKMVALGWSRGHVNEQMNRVRRVFKKAVASGLCPPEILLALKAVEPLREGETEAPELPAVESVPWPAVERILPFMTPHAADLVRLHWHCGARSEELCAMETHEIDYRGDVWIYVPAAHKGTWRGKARTICFGKNSQAAILNWLTPGYVFSPTKSMASIGRNHRGVGDRYDATSYQHAVNHGFRKLARSLGAVIPRWRDRREAKANGNPEGGKEDFLAALKSVGVEYWHPHQLRHSRATIVRDRWDIEAAGASIGDTIDAAAIYAEKSRRLAIEIAREIG